VENEGDNGALTVGDERRPEDGTGETVCEGRRREEIRQEMRRR